MHSFFLGCSSLFCYRWRFWLLRICQQTFHHSKSINKCFIRWHISTFNVWMDFFSYLKQICKIISEFIWLLLFFFFLFLLFNFLNQILIFIILFLNLFFFIFFDIEHMFKFRQKLHIWSCILLYHLAGFPDKHGVYNYSEWAAFFLFTHVFLIFL